MARVYWIGGDSRMVVYVVFCDSSSSVTAWGVFSTGEAALKYMQVQRDPEKFHAECYVVDEPNRIVDDYICGG